MMINELNIPNTEMWKYVDDTTISEILAKDQFSSIQSAVDVFSKNLNASNDKFQLNEGKCKELRINFSTKTNDNINAIKINDKEIDTVPQAKILGLHVSNDLKWNFHINEVIKKARRRLYCLRHLQRSGLGIKELIQFFCSCIRPITEYACPVFHNGLPSYLSEDLEVVQKRGLKIIYPELSYEQALAKSDLCPLSTRRQEITDRLFQSIIKGNDHKLKKLFHDHFLK